MCEGDDAYGGGVDVADVRSSKSRLHVSHGLLKQKPSSATFFAKRLQSFGTHHSHSSTPSSSKPASDSSSYGGSATPWTMAMCRQRPTEMCLFFLWTFNTFEGSLSCNIFSYALRQRLLSPLVNTIIKR